VILLDTHAWIWFLSNPELLSTTARDHIDTAAKKDAIYISSISVWEMALLVLKKRLLLKMDLGQWIAAAENLHFLNFVPVDNAIALKSVNLPAPLHSDPADRIIIASALALNALLVTKDEKILNYPFVNAVW
jgi:PIN domain nuclease of toxin-antitoxin system